MKINEIFYSIQGESSSIGLPTVFIRTTGCNLRCAYCDTTYAYEEGEEMSPQHIFQAIAGFACRRICLTGGEPLIQRPEELQVFLDLFAGWEVSIETNGSLPIDLINLQPGQRWVMDVKCPSSGHAGSTHLPNLHKLRRVDEVKFVIGSRTDYEWARSFIREHGLIAKCQVLLSPVHGILDPAVLAGWMLADGLDCRLQLQLHKLIWGDRRGV